MGISFSQKLTEQKSEIELIPVSWADERELLLTHYSGSKSVVGRRLFYRIFYQGQVVGVIGIQSCSLVMKRVMQEVFGENAVSTSWIETTKVVRKEKGVPVVFERKKSTIKATYLTDILNNNIFRLERNDAPNLSSRILSVFRKQAQVDYKKKYGTDLLAIISMTHGTSKLGKERTGVCYKADNWKELGMSKGIKKVPKGGLYSGKAEYSQGEPKHLFIYVFKRPKFRLLSQEEIPEKTCMGFNRKDKEYECGNPLENEEERKKRLCTYCLKAKKEFEAELVQKEEDKKHLLPLSQFTE